MMPSRFSLLIILIASFPAHCFAGTTAVESSSTACALLTTPYTASYFGSYKGWRIDTSQALEKRENGQWLLSVHADNFLGSILEKSYFTLTPENTVRSQEYHYQKKILLNNHEFQTTFDWNSHRATTSGDKTGTATLTVDALDDVNYQLAIRCDLMAGKIDMHYPVVDGNEVDDLEFKVTGEEVLDTQIGKVNTVVVKRVRSNKNRSTTLWFAKDLGYVMVKLLQEEKKDAEAYLLYIDAMSPLPHR